MLILIVVGSLTFFAFCALVCILSMDLYNDRVTRKLSYASVREKAEPASKVFKTLDEAGIKTNFLGRTDAKQENDDAFEENNDEIKVISM